jgi:hypothetical protein
MQPHRVSMLYVKLSNPNDADRLQARIERRFPELTVATSAGFADQEQLFELLDAVAMAVAGFHSPQTTSQPVLMRLSLARACPLCKK